MLSRIPIRARLTIVFASATAIALIATGVVLHVRLRASLDEAIDQNLSTRVGDVAELAAAGSSLPRSSSDDGIAQVLGPGGVVVGTTSLRRSLLTDAEIVRATRGRFTVARRVPDRLEAPYRLVAAPSGGTTGMTVVVAAPLEERDQTLAELDTELFVGGPIALLLASLGGYLLATAALRPVDRMRADAEAVSAAEPGHRLGLPPAHDEIRRLGETLNEMLERLEAAHERERQFVADASHELRAPLAVLNAELELALRRPREPAELEAALRSAAEESDRLTRLAEDLLVLARADEGQLQLRRDQVQVPELLTRVAGRFDARARDAGRELTVEPCAARLSVDGPRLEQALGNLVDNALRHGDGRIELLCVPGVDGVELHVIDEGAGFPPELLPRAFERFTRADGARGRGGTGLGLAIADSIAVAHGGSAHATNANGGGADVWLALPA